MSLFQDLKIKVTKGKENGFINMPKLDGRVPNTSENLALVQEVKNSSAGMGTVLSYWPAISGDNFDLIAFDVLINCYDSKREEDYLYARTFYGVLDSYDENNIPQIKHFISQFDMDGMLSKDGVWSDKLHKIDSFKEKISLSNKIQPMDFRFDSAIFRASDDGGIVYELQPNEQISKLGNNAFSIAKTIVEEITYVSVLGDNSVMPVSDTFHKNQKQGEDYLKTALDACLDFNKEFGDKTFDN